jgi:hypothetical protein
MRSGSASLYAGEPVIGLSASDRKFPALTGRSGTQRARLLWFRTIVKLWPFTSVAGQDSLPLSLS